MGASLILVWGKKFIEVKSSIADVGLEKIAIWLESQEFPPKSSKSARLRFHPAWTADENEFLILTLFPFSFSILVHGQHCRPVPRALSYPNSAARRVRCGFIVYRVVFCCITVPVGMDARKMLIAYHQYADTVGRTI
ncbi:MAG: hypothetical protein ABFD97_10995 [Syntrophobacter sp.]